MNIEPRRHLGFLSPAALAQAVLYEAAGTGMSRYQHFYQQVDEFREQSRPFSQTRMFAGARLSVHDFDSVPAFTHHEKPASAVVGHDGHLHHQANGKVTEHALSVNDGNPQRCTPDHRCDGHDAGHQHGPGCGHEAVPQGDHTDYLVGDHLHHPHEGHCDEHGRLARA